MSQNNSFNPAHQNIVSQSTDVAGNTTYVTTNSLGTQTIVVNQQGQTISQRDGDHR